MTRFRDIINRYYDALREDAFVKNLFLSFSGNALAQVIGFGFTPLITRVFSPVQYGIFAVFFSIASNLSTLSTMQLPAGFVAAQGKAELNNLIRISFLTLVSFTMLLLLCIVLFRNELASFWDAENLGILIYLIPLQVFVLGLDYLLLGWNISLKQFSRGAWGRVLSIFGGKGFTLGYGIAVAPSAYGLVVGNMLISLVDSAVKMSRSVRSELNTLLTDVARADLLTTLRKYRSYPLLVMPGIFVVGISQQLPLYVFSRLPDKGAVGFFALASSVIIIPLQMITTPVTTVFLQRAAELQQTDKSELSRLLYQLHRKLFLISFVAMAVLILLSDWIFLLVFGPEWKNAGVFASFIAVFAVLSICVQPLSVLFRLSHQEDRNFMINAVTLVLRFSLLAIGVYYGQPILGLAGFTLVSVLSSTATLFILFKMVDIRGSRIFPYALAVLSMFFVVVWKNRESLIR